ncbi:DUF222 domain-containing protein [Amycolatopsis regifaucium]|uniref:DUF222 domain-containing protein n=1 Tax=Amycolatopsis regifaucium TaxID=546365 RepID=A0A154MUA1_9PSEU|nr:DUF222 domain-containing protein [Amycolatopsis regifaucium]KZB87503.1 hypothetical protein AVL48_23020 [Amycolatopsis regifaucium]OKA08336.1 hypothetical protein ATP06_0213780 [Amycolatopsis regifaucium]SFI07368.1 protein of unknown function [Amycolatopsis regifaucium]
MTSKNTPKTFPLNLPEGDPELLLHELQTRLREGRRLFAEVGQILAEIEARGVRDLYGYNSIAVFYEHVARVSRAEAKKVAGRALALNSRRTRDGTTTPPVAPMTGAAAATGVLAEAGIDRIVTVMSKLPEHVAASARLDAEKVLVDLASVARPRDVTIAGTDLLARLDPDGNDTHDPTPRAPRSEFWLRQKRTGRWDLRGNLDPETGARLNALLVPLAQPAPNGKADDRTPAERRGDAFAEIVDLAESGPAVPMPRQASEPATEQPELAESVGKSTDSSRTAQPQEQGRQSPYSGSDSVRSGKARDVAHIRPPRWWFRLSRSRPGAETPSPTHGRSVVQISDENATHSQGRKTA